VNETERTKRNNIGKWNREEKPGEKKILQIRIEIVELSVECQGCTYQENSEKNKAFPENREVFSNLREIIASSEGDNRKKSNKKKLSKMTQRFPITREEEYETSAEEKCP
jgi:hypothetical protein